MVSQTGTKVVRSNSCKGPAYPGKGPNEYFGANNCYLGPNVLNLAPKGPTWQCVSEMSRLWKFSIRVQSWTQKFYLSPILIRKFLKIISPIQYYSAHAKLFILFCLI